MPQFRWPRWTPASAAAGAWAAGPADGCCPSLHPAGRVHTRVPAKTRPKRHQHRCPSPSCPGQSMTPWPCPNLGEFRRHWPRASRETCPGVVRPREALGGLRRGAPARLLCGLLQGCISYLVLCFKDPKLSGLKQQPSCLPPGGRWPCGLDPLRRLKKLRLSVWPSVPGRPLECSHAGSGVSQMARQTDRDPDLTPTTPA